MVGDAQYLYTLFDGDICNVCLADDFWKDGILEVGIYVDGILNI